MSWGMFTTYFYFSKPLLGLICFGSIGLWMWCIHFGPLSFRGDE